MHVVMVQRYFQEVVDIIKYHGNLDMRNLLYSETWTPTGENLDLEIRRPNEDLATNTD